MDYQTSSGKLKEGLARGISKGWKGFVWMMEIIIPVSFLTSLLEWSGWMEQIDFVIQPVMGVLSLPGVAALPLLIGMLTGIYGGIASMAVLPFNTGQMTLIAVFLLIAHNLIMEGIVQGKIGHGDHESHSFPSFFRCGCRAYHSTLHRYNRRGFRRSCDGGHTHRSDIPGYVKPVVPLDVGSGHKDFHNHYVCADNGGNT